MNEFTSRMSLYPAILLSLLAILLFTLTGCSYLSSKIGLASSEPQLTVLPLETSQHKEADEVMLSSVNQLKNVYGRTWLSDTKLIINKNNRLQIHHITTGAETPLTPNRTSPQYLALTSQDGQHVFFTEGVDGDPYAIQGYILEISTRKVTSIGALEMWNTVSWADNQHLITDQSDGGIRLIDLNGHSSELELPNRSITEGINQVQKVGKIIYYLGQDTNLYQLVQYADKPAPTITLIAADIGAFAVSPDGKQIAIEQRIWNTTEPARLIMIDAEGNVQGTIGQGSLLSRGQWSADSRLLAFSIYQQNQQGMSGLYIFDQHTGKTTPVFADIQDSNSSAQWNPAGDHLSIYDEDQGVITYIVGITK